MESSASKNTTNSIIEYLDINKKALPKTEQKSFDKQLHALTKEANPSQEKVEAVFGKYLELLQADHTELSSPTSRKEIIQAFTTLARPKPSGRRLPHFFVKKPKTTPSSIRLAHTLSNILEKRFGPISQAQAPMASTNPTRISPRADQPPSISQKGDDENIYETAIPWQRPSVPPKPANKPHADQSPSISQKGNDENIYEIPIRLERPPLPPKPAMKRTMPRAAEDHAVAEKRAKPAVPEKIITPIGTRKSHVRNRIALFEQLSKPKVTPKAQGS